MSYLWYPLLAAVVACWVFIDARVRHANSYWVAAVAIAGPIGLATYLVFRPLLPTESREGGRSWQFLSMLVVAWTATFAVAALWNVALPFIDMATLALAWACIALPALVVGLALKRNTTEYGPTGAFGAIGPWYSVPERTSDGRAYVCLECGKEYSVDLPFCDGCGAWPGQNG